jgi:hypothetical protein
MTPSGIEPATFRFVAQYLNHCATISGTQTAHKFSELFQPSFSALVGKGSKYFLVRNVSSSNIANYGLGGTAFEEEHKFMGVRKQDAEESIGPNLDEVTWAE